VALAFELYFTKVVCLPSLIHNSSTISPNGRPSPFATRVLDFFAHSCVRYGAQPRLGSSTGDKTVLKVV